jgi:hypothetical protein
MTSHARALKHPRGAGQQRLIRKLCVGACAAAVDLAGIFKQLQEVRTVASAQLTAWISDRVPDGNRRALQNDLDQIRRCVQHLRIMIRSMTQDTNTRGADAGLYRESE